MTGPRLHRPRVHRVQRSTRWTITCPQCGGLWSLVRWGLIPFLGQGSAMTAAAAHVRSEAVNDEIREVAAIRARGAEIRRVAAAAPASNVPPLERRRRLAQRDDTQPRQWRGMVEGRGTAPTRPPRPNR